MVLQADLVVFIEIFLYVEPQRIKYALKPREKKAQLVNLLFLDRRNSTEQPSGHCRAHAHPPFFWFSYWSAQGCGIYNRIHGDMFSGSPGQSGRGRKNYFCELGLTLPFRFILMDLPHSSGIM